MKWVKTASQIEKYFPMIFAILFIIFLALAAKFALDYMNGKSGSNSAALAVFFGGIAFIFFWQLLKLAN